MPGLAPTRLRDLEGISDLTEEVFGRRRSPELLRWLLLPERPGLAVESRVVHENGRVIGHVAVVKSKYLWQGQVVAGGHPMLWMLAPGHRGWLAISLGRWSTEHGDLSLVIGGTPSSQPIMRRRSFVEAGIAREFRLATQGLDPPGNVELSPFETDHASDRPEAPGAALPPDTTPGAPPDAPPDAPVVNLAGISRLGWLAECPDLEGRIFRIRRDGDEVGLAMLYVNHETTPATGRIVHLPWMPRGGRAALLALLAAAAEAGCATATILTTSAAQESAARELGGEPFYERPIFFRNQSGLPRAPAWHLSYLEGDLAYRGV